PLTHSCLGVRAFIVGVPSALARWRFDSILPFHDRDSTAPDVTGKTNSIRKGLGKKRMCSSCCDELFSPFGCHFVFMRDPGAGSSHQKTVMRGSAVTHETRRNDPEDRDNF